MTTKQCFGGAFTANKTAHETAHETKHAAGIKSGIKSGQSQLQHAMLERVIRELSGHETAQIRHKKRHKYGKQAANETVHLNQRKPCANRSASPV